MKKIAYILGFVLLLTSCESFLDRTPITSIGSDVYFTNETALQTYLNGFLRNYVPSQATLGYGDGYSDITATQLSTTYLYSQQWTPSQQSGWDSDDWNPIYNINYFLVHFREVPDLSEETYNHYEGTARFWRAWKYWDFVKTFGAVPWYEEPIDAGDEEALYKARDSREYVMDKVLEDLNFACENVLATSDWTNSQQVSKYVALALKIRICLFEGTYRKYHSVDPSTGKAWEDGTASTRFLTECANACEELMNSGVYKLVDNEANRETQYKNLFTSDDIDYTENIWVREYSSSMAIYNDLTWRFTSSTYGSKWSFDQDFVQTYLHRDGRRHYEVIEERRANGEDVTLTTEFFNTEMDASERDARLRQEMISTDYHKTFSGVDSLFAPVLTTAITGYQPIKWNKDDHDYDGASIGAYSLPIFRYAEALVSYAEAKCELGQFSDDVWDKTIRLLRERAGISAEGSGRRTDIDQTLATYYGGLTDPDLVEIRRERAIEMLLENLRYDDLMRWHCGELLNKTWYGIYIPEKNVAYDLNGNGVLDVCVIDSSDKAISGVTTTIDLSDTDLYTLENGDSGRLVLNVPRYFDEQRYLRPIPKTALDINPALGQNYYWQ